MVGYMLAWEHLWPHSQAPCHLQDSLGMRLLQHCLSFWPFMVKMIFLASANLSNQLVQSTSPVHQSSSPVQFTSPVHQSSPPVQFTSPVHQSSPPVQSTSPVHQSSPRVQFTSPVRPFQSSDCRRPLGCSYTDPVAVYNIDSCIQLLVYTLH